MSSSFKWIYGQVINIRWKQENMAFVQKKVIPKSKLYEEKHFSFETFHLSKVKSTAELSPFLCFGSFALLNMHFHQLKCSNCNGFKEFNKSSVHWQRLKYNAIVPVTVCVRVCVCWWTIILNECYQLQCSIRESFWCLCVSNAVILSTLFSSKTIMLM